MSNVTSHAIHAYPNVLSSRSPKAVALSQAFQEQGDVSTALAESFFEAYPKADLYIPGHKDPNTNSRNLTHAVKRNDSFQVDRLVRKPLVDSQQPLKESLEYVKNASSEKASSNTFKSLLSGLRNSTSTYDVDKLSRQYARAQREKSFESDAKVEELLNAAKQRATVKDALNAGAPGMLQTPDIRFRPRLLNIIRTWPV